MNFPICLMRCGMLACWALVTVHPTQLLGAEPPATSTWSAGAASVVITPPAYMWMSGYGGRDHPAEGKLTDLWAKALVLQDPAGAQFVVITLDLVGIDRDLSRRICQALETNYRLPRETVALCVSHTHSGPVVGDNLSSMYRPLLDERQKELIKAYGDRLMEAAVEVVGVALRQVQPAQLSYGQGFSTVAVNRRENSEAKVPDLRRAGQLRGPVDYDVPVLAVRDVEGRLRAILFGYACHATVLSGYQWCGDYPTYAHQELERRHDDCLALFWAGCGADQNPLPRREVALAERYGQRLADAVDEALDGVMPLVDGTLKAEYREIPLAFQDLPTRPEIAREAEASDRFIAARARSLLEELDRGQPLSPTYPYPVQTVRLGDQVRFVLLGGEVVVDYALRLKTEDAHSPIWIAGYVNDVMAYIPSRRVLTEGGYEGGGAMVYYGLPAAWAPQVEEDIIREVHRQLVASP